MREHEMENSRPAPRNTPSLVIWLLFVFSVALGGFGLLATGRSEVAVSASAANATRDPAPRPAPASTGQSTSEHAADRVPTAMGD